MASMPYPRTPLSHACTSLSSASRSSFPFSPLLFSSSYSLLLSSAPTDADARIDRRRCSYRPTQTSAPTDADACIDRRGWFLLVFCSAKPLLSCCQTVAFAVQNLPFHISLPLFLAISSPVFLNQRCFHVVCILWLHSLKTVSLAYNNIMCASTMRCFNCK